MLTDGRTDDGRTPDAGVTGILIAHLRAFGSGELKKRGKAVLSTLVRFQTTQNVPAASIF